MDEYVLIYVTGYFMAMLLLYLQNQHQDKVWVRRFLGKVSFDSALFLACFSWLWPLIVVIGLFIIALDTDRHAEFRKANPKIVSKTPKNRVTEFILKFENSDKKYTKYKGETYV